MEYLRLKVPMMHGPSVKRLQEMLHDLGYDLGQWGIDGIFGADADKTVRKFQADNGLDVDGIVGPATWTHLEAAVTAEDEVLIIDRRGKHEHPRLYSQGRSPRVWNGGTGNVIRGVTLHQTGVFLSETPRRWDSLNAHIGVLASGSIIITNELEDFIWHAQGLSSFTIGIEFNGNFEGVSGKPETLWQGGGGPARLTAGQLRAADRLFDWLKDAFEQNGGSWEVVHAHRQSSNSRRADPGSEIWSKVAMPWLERLGATDGGSDWTVGDGRKIPKSWNPDYSAPY